MPQRDDETPTSPEIAAKLARIAERVRRRSTRTTEIAQLAAMEALVLLDIDRDDPRLERRPSRSAPSSPGWAARMSGWSIGSS